MYDPVWHVIFCSGVVKFDELLFSCFTFFTSHVTCRTSVVYIHISVRNILFVFVSVMPHGLQM